MTPREELASLLRDARIAAGYSSQAKLASALHVSRPLISRAENPGEALPSADVIAGYVDVTGADAAKIAELTERAKSGTPDWFVPWRSAETAASLLRYWQPFLVPGIVQTVGYMRALFTDEGHLLDQIDDLVTARLARRSVIGRVPLTMIIGYPVLYRVVGSPAVMAEQMGYLAGVAERVAVHVLPEGMTTGSGGALDLATRDGLTTVCLTTNLEDVTSTAEQLVVRAHQMFDRLLGEAMPRTESLTLIRSAEDQWKTQS